MKTPLEDLKNKLNEIKTDKTKPEPQVVKGLALGGGGSRGSYTIGVLKAFEKAGLKFDVVSGTSIGALVGAVYVQKDYSKVASFMSNFRRDMVVTNPFVFPNQYTASGAKTPADFFNTFTEEGPSDSPLRLAYQRIFDFDQFKDSSMDFACLSWNVTKNQPVIFYKKDMTKENCLDELIASTAFFPAFNLSHIDGDYYLDGGYCNYPLGKICQEMGAQKMWLIGLHNPDEKMPAVQENVALEVRPILKLAFYMDFSSSTLLRQVEQGYLEGLKYLDLAPGYLYTFYKDDGPMLQILSDIANRFIEKNGISWDLEMVREGFSILLGYKPAALDNTYIKHQYAGLLLEVLGLVAGIDMYKQYHITEFANLLLEKFQNNRVDLDPAVIKNMALDMDQAGAADLMVFFHSAIQAFGVKLPPEFDGFMNKYKSVYYLALAWYVLDHFSLALKLAAHF